MASAKLYLRPIGLLYGATAAEAVAEGLALPLAGGPIAFTAAELIEGVPGNTRMRLFTAHALVSSGEADLASLLARITAKRPPFAGVALDRPVLMGIVNVTPDSFSDGGLLRHQGGGDRSCRRARHGRRRHHRCRRRVDQARVRRGGRDGGTRPRRAGDRGPGRAPCNHFDRYAQSIGGARRRQARRENPERRVGAHP